MPPTRLTLGKRHFMSYLFYQVLEFYVMGILYKIEKQIKIQTDRQTVSSHQEKESRIQQKVKKSFFI